MANRQFILGIDSGASSLRVYISDNNGVLLGRGIAPGTNVHNNPRDLKHNISLALKKALKETVVEFKLTISHFDACCIGISGLDVPRDFTGISKAAKARGFKSALKCLPNTPIIIVNDAFLGLSFGSYRGYGIALISGTGNQCYGVDKDGVVATAGNWGYLLGDLGSGFHLGKALLHRVMEEFDGRSPPTSLTPAILREFKMKSVEDLYTHIYSSALPIPLIAQAARVLNDRNILALPLTRNLLSHFIITHTKSFASVFHRLHFNTATEVDVVLMGGIFFHHPVITRQLSQEITRFSPATSIKILQEEPVLGAVEIAFKYLTRKPLILPKTALIV